MATLNAAPPPVLRPIKQPPTRVFAIPVEEFEPYSTNESREPSRRRSSSRERYTQSSSTRYYNLHRDNTVHPPRPRSPSEKTFTQRIHNEDVQDEPRHIRAVAQEPRRSRRVEAEPPSHQPGLSRTRPQQQPAKEVRPQARRTSKFSRASPYQRVPSDTQRYRDSSPRREYQERYDSGDASHQRVPSRGRPVREAPYVPPSAGGSSRTYPPMAYSRFAESTNRGRSSSPSTLADPPSPSSLVEPLPQKRRKPHPIRRNSHHRSGESSDDSGDYYTARRRGPTSGAIKQVARDLLRGLQEKQHLPQHSRTARSRSTSPESPSPPPSRNPPRVRKRVDSATDIYQIHDPPPQRRRSRRRRRVTTEFDNFYTPENARFYSCFHYPPLDPMRQEIRLLQIDTSGRGEHKMFSRLPLSSVYGSYSAISYYSGSPNETRQIIIDGVSFNAFKNLADAFDQVIEFWNRQYSDMRPRPRLLLWADQICIDQSNNPERSHQVGFMREIYQRAQQVFVSLCADKEYKSGWRWLPTVQNPSIRLLKAEMITTSSFQLFSLSRRGIKALKQLNHLYEILEDPWWTRAWVFQEFMVSSRSYFLIGDDVSVPWDYFSTALTELLEFNISEYIDLLERALKNVLVLNLNKLKIERHLSRIRNGDTTREAVRYVVNKKKNWTGLPLPLSSLLTHSRNCKTSELRDKVYAFLGLAGANAYNITPAYDASNTINTVFVETARAIITAERSLDILLAATSDRDLHDGDDLLPSWVPDWSMKQTSVHHNFPSTIGFRPSCRTTRNQAPQVTYHPDARGNPGRILQARGYYLGKLESVRKDEYGPTREFNHSYVSEQFHRFGRLRVVTTEKAQRGDELWVLLGTDYPFVLRRMFRSDHRTLLGMAMIHTRSAPDRSGPAPPSIMDGGLITQGLPPTLVKIV